jgi:flagellin-like hook-associated protein FlgL
MEKVAYKEDINNTNLALKTATISSLFDTDVAKEYTELTKNMLLQSTINSLLNKSFSANASLWKLITG